MYEYIKPAAPERFKMLSRIRQFEILVTHGVQPFTQTPKYPQNFTPVRIGLIRRWTNLRVPHLKSGRQ